MRSLKALHNGEEKLRKWENFLVVGEGRNALKLNERDE